MPAEDRVFPDPDGWTDYISCVRIGEPVPVQVKQLVAEVPKSSWMVSNSARYRKCSALHFGLVVHRFQKTWLGKASERFPDLQRLIIGHVKKIHPDICFSSFILNRYVAGNLMGRHDDKNLQGHSTQAVFIWGDFLGGELAVYKDDGSPIVVPKGPVGLLMDGNAKHEVAAVTSGTRYSIVTYAKQTFAGCPAEVKCSLTQMGFPLPDIGVSGIPSQSASPQGFPTNQCCLGQADHASLCAILLDWFDKMCEGDRQTTHTTITNVEFLRRLQAQRDSGDFCDVLISITSDGKNTYRCHQCVLAAHSGHLHDWLLQGRKGCDIQEVSVDNACSQAMGIILDHIYGLNASENLRAGSLCCIWEVCKVALAWKVTGLFGSCKDVATPHLGELETHELRGVLRYFGPHTKPAILYQADSVLMLFCERVSPFCSRRGAWKSAAVPSLQIGPFITE
jgi:hypothetical protein